MKTAPHTIRLKPVRLDVGNFKPEQQIPGHITPVGRLTVEQGHVLGVKAGPIRLYLQAVHEEPVTPGGSSHSVDLGALGLYFAFTKRKSPAFPTAKHNDIRGYQRISGAWQPAEVNAADAAAGTVGLNIDTNADAVRVYYVPLEGEVRLDVSAPAGSGRSLVQLVNWTMRELAEAAPTGYEMLRIPKDAFLIEDYALQLTVNTKNQMAALDEPQAKHELRMEAEIGRVEYTPGGLAIARARINYMLGLGVS